MILKGQCKHHYAGPCIWPDKIHMIKVKYDFYVEGSTGEGGPYSE
jgi:hypothetical protein